MNRFIVVSALLACCWLPALGQDFLGMKYRVPHDSNTLILINAEKMFGSPVADLEKWNAKRKAAYDSGVSGLPPDAAQVIMAARTDYEFGKPIWEVALVRLNAPRTVATVAQRYGGSLDTIGGRNAARLPGDHIVVQINETLLGSRTPANRQDVTRWLKATDSSSSENMPAYLQQAFDYATKVGTPIVMAIDLEGAISPEDVKRKIPQFASLKDSTMPADQIAGLISGAKGITLGVSLGTKAGGAIRVDFSQPLAINVDTGKRLMIEVLQRHGAMIDDIYDWTPSINENTFLLRGELSTNGMRRVMSVLELPHTLSDAMVEATSPGADPEGTGKKLASQQYFKSVNTLIEDLREKPKRDGVRTFGQAAIWYDKYARKIDRMPILNVDEELLDYGTQISVLLRDAEMAMKGVGMRSSVRTAENNPSSGGYSTGYGGYRAGMGYTGGMYGSYGYSLSVGAGRASLQEKGRTDAIIRGQERTQGASTVQQIWQQIDESTAAIRRKMVNKYSADF
jgi:hypothetical protein